MEIDQSEQSQIRELLRTKEGTRRPLDQSSFGVGKNPF